MIKNIITLTLNDLAIAVKNKTFFLIFFIPLFVFFVLKMVDTKSQDFQKINLGLIKNESYSPVVKNSIIKADKIFNITYTESKEIGTQLVKDKVLDGLLLKSEELIVLKKGSVATLTIVENVNAIQQMVEGKRNWISNVTAIQSTDIQKESLPTWILMLILLVGFFIIPTQVAEEKEKKLLLSLLQTPMREIEWLTAKVLLGIFLSTTSIFLLHLIGSFKFEINSSYIAMILLGSFCFSSYGVFVGFLCRNQASARIMGVIFYLPHLLPSALADFSKKMSGVAPILPSYHLFESLKLILFDGVKMSALGFGSMYLFLVGVGTFLISYLLMKKRWLM